STCPRNGAPSCSAIMSQSTPSVQASLLSKISNSASGTKGAVALGVKVASIVNGNCPPVVGPTPSHWPTKKPSSPPPGLSATTSQSDGPVSLATSENSGSINRITKPCPGSKLKSNTL